MVFVLASPWFFSWLLFSSHPPSQYVSKFLVFSFNNTNDYKITARKALLTSMTICYSVQQEAQTLVSYENLWFVYLSLRALGVPRLELCCWKSPHELEDRNIQKLLIADLNICSSNVNKWSTSGHKHFVKLSRKLLPMGNAIFNVRRKSKNQTL